MTTHPANSAEQLPLPVPEIDYVARWRQIIERRRMQMDTAYERAGIVHADYWGRRAKSYRAATHAATADDPLIERVLRIAGGETSVLDVGAGTGRHTLALAPRVGRVTAVEPSDAMLGLLREDIAAQKLHNVDTVQAEWMDADVQRADVVICSHVLYPIADVVPFIEKLEACAEQRVFVYLRADPVPTDFGFWKDFHGESLQDQPTHRDLFNLLVQTGIMADLEIVPTTFHWSFESLDDAANQLAGALCLRDDDEPSRARLRELMRERWDEVEGRVMPPPRPTRSAIVSWAPRH
jgi:SAM-dependent methyltransferase